MMDQEAYDAVKGNDHRRLARRLKEAGEGIDISSLNGAGLTMLHVACYQGNLECARLLLEIGKANAHVQGRSTKSTPLHLACLSGNPELAKLLLQYQARPNVMDDKGKTALHYAAVGGHTEVIRLLLDAGASTKMADNQGRTPYEYALEKDQQEAAKLLGHIAKADFKEDMGMENTFGIDLDFDKMGFRDGVGPSDNNRRNGGAPVRPHIELKRQADKLKKKADDLAGKIGGGWDDGPKDDGRGAGGALWVPVEGDRANKFKANMARNGVNGGLNNKPSKAAGPGVGRGAGGGGAGGRAGAGDDGARRRAPTVEDEDIEGGDSPAEVKEYLEKELKGIVGMESVKGMLRSLCRKMVVDHQRAKYGFVNQQNLNMLFLGNPGTGKTSMARVVAKLLKYMGILKKGHLVEVSRKDLVAEYSGQSAVKTMAKVQEAIGGILFVDEAYSLKHADSKDSFGQEVVDCLVAEMENRRSELLVIMAGYTKEMGDFLRSNSGLQSRFPNVFDFPDYSYTDMAEIFKGMAEERKLKVDPAVTTERLVELIQNAIPRSIASKGNARAVRNLVESVLTRQTDRVADKGTTSMESLLTLTEEDFSVQPGGDSSKPGTPGLGPSDPVSHILQQLDNIVGVQGVKDLFRSLRAKITIAEEKRRMGLPAEGASSLHMIFTGAPGTGKTTIARLMGELFKALRLLPSGHLVEVSRPDLVGEHVGETAPKTKRALESAVGGVLFVDEAYTLVSDSKDGFGREALETLMKGMEDMRDEVIIILAGYPEQMDELLTRNPGLKSRFPIAVPFPDYTASELVEIAVRMLKEKQLALSPDAHVMLRNMCERAKDDPMAGNARFVRNLLEKATMRQAERLCALPERSREQLITLEACDIGGPGAPSTPHVRQSATAKFLQKSGRAGEGEGDAA